MCGIFMHYNGDNASPKDYFAEFDEDQLSNMHYTNCTDQLGDLKSVIPLVVQRGPNYASLRVSEQDKMLWFSSILSLRDPLTKQSIDIQDRFVLQYNGECYNSSILHNDTQWIVDQLTQYSDVPRVIRLLSGEFAYTVYDRLTKQVFFGRDSIGKRSLSFRLGEEAQELTVSSVTGKTEGFENCVAGVIYVYDTATNTLSAECKIKPADFVVSSKEDPELLEVETHTENLMICLSDAVKCRLETIHPLHTENSPIAILFSGGLDCSVIAALVCQHITNSGSYAKVELLNVGFENPRTGLMPEDVPDRLLGQTSYKTLQALYPEVDIRFLEVDVGYEDYLKYKTQILNLIYPKQTEMDLSIAAAFYFAARGEAFLTDDEKETRTRYNRKGIVLFSGLGADELYGGYHKLANKSKDELVTELERQINNIHDRNLSRDDKVLASNGVEVRYPFLDETVVEFSTKLPLNYKINKMILRRLAQNKLLLIDIGTEPKRAIQFGAKSAKMTKNGNKHGTDLVKDS
ncbi:LAME_0G19988g1_1 [Lachancea meyersii CBS 8951]|uniref:LAME_0G19988g1_1 n=1 Tax=Lachancea meyersii CBS 8951 TaxID=1266667 RepID=A0A1G4KCF6_9SACH|nr:LAME_0G19988g1_1 [Lachancea meyersii CBS 8951]